MEDDLHTERRDREEPNNERQGRAAVLSHDTREGAGQQAHDGAGGLLGVVLVVAHLL